jgi:hypothetical protein
MKPIHFRVKEIQLVEISETKESEVKENEKKTEITNTSTIENILQYFPEMEDFDYGMNSTENDSEVSFKPNESNSLEHFLSLSRILNRKKNGIFEVILCVFQHYLDFQMENSIKKYFLQLSNILLNHQISLSNEFKIFICELFYYYGNPDEKAYSRRILHSFTIDVLCERKDSSFQELNSWKLRSRALWILGNLHDDQNRSKYCFEECINQFNGVEEVIKLNHW